MNELRPERGTFPFSFGSLSGSLSQFEGTLQVTGGIPLAVGLRDLILELPDERRLEIEVASIRREGNRETYEIRGTVQPWWARIRFQQNVRWPST